MITRRLTEEDIPKLEALHQKYFSHLECPNFRKLLQGFVIENARGELVIGGAIDLVAEVMLVTDKSKSNVSIGRALKEAQALSLFICKQYQLDEMLAFTDQDAYEKHLIKHGFVRRNQNVLSMRVKHG